MDTSYCLFEINQCHSAVSTTYVEEVFSLPELILIPNAPLGIIGVIDLRGDTLPIVDLQLNNESNEASTRDYQLTDSIIVLRQADLRVGIIVNAIRGIRELSIQDLTINLEEYEETFNLNLKRFFAGVVSDETNIFILNTPQDWFKTGEIQQVISVTRFLVDDFYDSRAGQDLAKTQRSEENATAIFSPKATLEERAIFQQRSENLRQSLEEEHSAVESKSLVAISLDGNLFGNDSNLVQEFITVNQATPIPCCPKHIIGAINLRGEILTVIDIAKSLGLSLKEVPRVFKAIVIEFKNTLIAIIVENVRDALFSINPNDIQSIADAPSVKISTYVQGIVTYRDESMQVLDLTMLLDSDELVVNEVL